MKLYHIDRTGHLNENQTLYLKENFYTDTTNNEYYKEGLSSHGLYYYLDNVSNKNFAYDVIFEYERLLHFKDKLSRYQALYAFDINGVMNFIEKRELNDNFYKIYEVDTDYYEKHNMNLVRGWSHCIISKMAKLYWKDEEDSDKSLEPVYEYLLKFPVKIGKEVSYKEISEEYEKTKKLNN